MNMKESGPGGHVLSALLDPTLAMTYTSGRKNSTYKNVVQFVANETVGKTSPINQNYLREKPNKYNEISSSVIK